MSHLPAHIFFWVYPFLLMTVWLMDRPQQVCVIFWTTDPGVPWYEKKKVLETQSAGNSHKLNLIEIYTLLMSNLEVVRKKLEMRNTEHLIYRYHFYCIYAYVRVGACLCARRCACLYVCVSHNCMYSSSQCRVNSLVAFLFSRQPTHWPWSSPVWLD